MFQLTLQQTQSLLDSYDKEIASLEANLAAVKSLRYLLAQKCESLTIDETTEVYP